MALVYLGVALGSPAPLLPLAHGQPALQAEAETQRLFTNRSEARLALAAEKADPRTPLLSGPHALKPDIGDIPRPTSRALRANAPRAPPVRTAEHRQAHRPRAPPSAAT
ncbi:hypothetical protein L1787_10200 [Acuticoccus sp. M5D2P5]|uniref:hypothetical protein n=1 Tax=Acuticoccus kalidii TaxID=2910977 RepID=UPI001F3B9F19|nr:hypothetical protein [Acuticoccus kalidii]MCF3933785.1 hypothetical protein [Acuticoccus kalidii]